MRLSDSVVKDVTNPDSNVLNIAHGSRGGYMASIIKKSGGGSEVFENWINAAPYVTRNLIPVVISTPKGFDKLKGDLPKRMKEQYIELMESQPLRIEGFKSALNVETADVAFGHDGQQFKATTKIGREISEPSFTWAEIQHKSILRYLNFLVELFEGTPETNGIPLIAQESDYFEAEVIFTADMGSGTMVFIEPDVTRMTAIETYVCFGMRPIGTIGVNESKFEVAGAGETREYTVAYSALTIPPSNATRALGNQLLKDMKVLKLSPKDAVTIKSRDADVKAIVDSGSGFDNTDGFN